MNINTEWLYVITDSNSIPPEGPKEIQNAKDGYNIAFLYNASNSQKQDCKVRQILYCSYRKI